MGRENRREIVPRALSPPPVQTQRLSFLIIIIIIIMIMIMIMIMINYNNKKKTYIAPISLLLFSSALKKKNKQTNKVHELTKKLKQLCQHYGVGSEQAPGEGGVETS